MRKKAKAGGGGQKISMLGGPIDCSLSFFSTSTSTSSTSSASTSTRPLSPLLDLDLDLLNLDLDTPASSSSRPRPPQPRPRHARFLPPHPKNNNRPRHQQRIGAVATSAATGVALSLFAGDPEYSWLDFQFDAASTASAVLRRTLDGERAHVAAVWAASRGLLPKDSRPDPPSLRVAAFGREFRNPLGLAAGFDKDAEGAEALLNLGFGFIEVGSVTPQPQPGNPKPRVFRVPSQGAIINRYGFNSKGHEPALKLVSEFRGRFPIDSSPPPPRETLLSPHHPAAPGRLGINLGKNKAQEDASRDFSEGARRFAPLADFLVVNVSSPNTPGLRALQGRKALTALLKAAVSARDAGVEEAGVGAGRGSSSDERRRKKGWLGGGAGGAGIFSSSSSSSSSPSSSSSSFNSHTPPLLVKIDPDLDDAAAADVAAAALTAGVDGIVVSNTTISRPRSLVDAPDCGERLAREAGGLSGRPLREISTATVARMYRLTKGKLPIVGVGGVDSGEAAYEKIRAGASLVELYTALAFEGPALVPRVKKRLAELLKRDGFGSVAEAVGVDADKYGKAK